MYCSLIKPKVVLTFESMEKLLTSVIIEMKAIEQYFPVVLFIMLYKMFLTCESVDEFLNCDHSIETTEQYVPVVLFIMLYKVVLTFESVDEILKCDHSNESYCESEQYFPVVLFIVVQGGSKI